MTVLQLAVTPQRIQPFMREDNADPIGQMFGLTTSTGDASGGIHAVGFSLPRNNVYLIRFLKADISSAVDLVIDMSIGMGIVADGVTMSWRKTATVVSDGTNAIDMFEPERLLILPDSDPTLNIIIPNILNQTLGVQFAAVFWSKQAFINLPSDNFSRYL